MAERSRSEGKNLFNMILKATSKDLEQIYKLTKSCAQHLIEQNIFQWNEYYPSQQVLQKDIDLNQIWTIKVENELAGIVVLTEIEDDEYENVKWLTKNKNNLYIHRLAVHPEFQGKGFAQQLMTFAEDFARKNNYKSVRLDTFGENKRNLRFYEKRGYQKLEKIYFPKQSKYPFYCFELVV
ncbi:Ribosomal protein S18 acetylase RimI [Lutibacter oricola]|uniref:Ribosomal protein S18 acetylase RimI n=2 Tax=Lutibacter oricola TaxID=762486 RepID=A0A1H3DBT3_9FLAO|nr:Ribosomal protein S18 acetylase RimI [Lutibacter oricola]